MPNGKFELPSGCGFGGLEDQLDEVNRRLRELLKNLLEFNDIYSYKEWINNALQQCN